MISGNNQSDSLKQRIESIENQLAKTTSSYDQKQLKERLGILSNGVATIKVGATTESELKEKNGYGVKYEAKDVVGNTGIEITIESKKTSNKSS